MKEIGLRIKIPWKRGNQLVGQAEGAPVAQLLRYSVRSYAILRAIVLSASKQARKVAAEEPANKL